MSRFVVEQAKTHRKGGLKVAAESFSGSTLYGWIVSPYTAKVRSMLAHKSIPFTDNSPSAMQLFGMIKPAVGRLIMPTMRLADGTWRQDSALICDEIEAEHPEPTCKPTGAAQRLASSLLELHADEWLPMLALHYRWDKPENSAWAQGEFGRIAFPLLPAAISGVLAKPMADRMRATRKTLGVEPATHAGVEAHASCVIGTLEAHLSTGHPYLLGGKPCRGDFALYGPIYAHLYRDPACRSLFSGAPHVVEWMERLHGHDTDPAFPELPCRRTPHNQPDDEQSSSSSSAYLSADSVPETLDPLFRAIFAEHWAHITDLSRALDAHLDAAAAAAATDKPQLPVPRALGSADFVVGGAKGRRRLLTHGAWHVQRPLDLYNTLKMAPSRSLELASADKWLTRLGALEAFTSLTPKWRIERENALPSEKEVFYAARAPSSRL